MSSSSSSGRAGRAGRATGRSAPFGLPAAAACWTSCPDVWNNRAVVPQPLDSQLVKALLAGSHGAAVDRAALEAAVNQQLIHGGSLDTLILEAELTDERTLAKVLEDVWQTTPVAPSLFRAPDERAVARLPRRMAVAMGLVPLFVDDADRLHLACRSPLDADLIGEVGELLKATVVAHVVPEVRLRQGLSAAYGHDLDERFVALLRRLEPDAVAAAARAQPAPGPNTTDEPVVSWDMVEALAHLVAQDSRDGIARVAVNYARTFLPFAAIFGVRDGQAVGWQRLGASEGLQFSRPFTIPADGLLQAALQSASPVLLRPDTSEGSAAFFGWLGRRRPQTALVVPIVVARRPIGALYADGGVRHRDPRDVGELTAFAARLGPAFEALLRQRHRQHPSIFPQPATTGLPGLAEPPTSLTPTLAETLEAPPSMSTPLSTLEAPPSLSMLESTLEAPPSLSMQESTLEAPPSLEAAATLVPTSAAGLEAPPPLSMLSVPVTTSSSSMPSLSSSMPSVLVPRKDGTSPFARGYAPPLSSALPSAPAPAPDRGSEADTQAAADGAVAGTLGAIVISGVGEALNEHLPRRQSSQSMASLSSLSALSSTSSSPSNVASSSSAASAAASSSLGSAPFFPLEEGRASEAWRGALQATVERGLQGGTGTALDDDLDWEAVVYDPAHAAELDAPGTATAPKVAQRSREVIDFNTLSSNVLADLYNGNDDSAEGAPVDDAPTPMTATTTTPSTTPPSPSTTTPPSTTTTPPSTTTTPPPPAPLPLPLSLGQAPLSSQSHRELVELLFAGDDDIVRRAGRELVSRGLAGVPALGERFPGRLLVDPFDPGDNVRSADRLGPLIDVLCRLGPDGLDAAIPHVDSRYPAHRFAAVLLFAATPDARAIDLLRNRLHDAEPRIQKLAAEALVPFLAHPRFESLLIHLRERTSAATKPYPLEARRRAAELLGEFRDVGSVPLLLGLLAFPEMQETARLALRAITLQDLGARPKAWDKWWQRAKKRSRLDWLIEGLASEELDLRSAAHRELADLAGDDFGYRADGDKRARQRAVEVWQHWWTEEQKRTVHPKAAARL